MGSVETPHFTPPTAKPPMVHLVDRYIDEPRSLRVAVIGGGLSGITAGILLPAKVPGIQLTIYEKNAELSGTWLTNTYPGVRCDIPSHAYQSTFAPKPDWTDAFSYGPEIRDYWQSVASQHNVYQYVKLRRRVEAAVWDQATGTWAVTVQDVSDPASPTTTDTFDVVITAVGRFDNWALPDYPGLADFKGHLRHAQNWDPSFDPTGKRVAVIGNGASGIQLVTNLQRTVKHLDHYVRNRTWIASSFAASGITTTSDEATDAESQLHHERKAFAQPYPEKDIAKRLADPAAYLAFRKSVESRYWQRFATVFKDSPANATIRESFTKTMIERVAKKPALLQDLIPDFSPNCRRLTPGPGYLEALTEDNVDYIRTPIARFTATGIETTDGVHREVDAIICATGADTTQSVLSPPFPVRGADGKLLSEVYRARGYPYTYLGTATPGFPNLFFILGPNASGPSGTIPYSVETQTTHISKILRKISREGVRSMAPSTKATDDFVAWANKFFDKTVFTEPCRSWYNAGNPGGFISGLWPGSTSHLTAVRREPRWEDYEYTHLGSSEHKGEESNRFAWYFGNGWTRKEKDQKEDMTGYLHVPGTISLRDVHEGQYSLP